MNIKNWQQLWVLIITNCFYITNTHENEQVRGIAGEEDRHGLEEYAKDVVMDLHQIIGNGLTVRTGPILIGDLENPTTTQNMMKTE